MFRFAVGNDGETSITDDENVKTSSTRFMKLNVLLITIKLIFRSFFADNLRTFKYLI